MLNIHLLNNIRDQKKINQISIFKKVLEKCHHRIKTISLQGGSYGVYIIPEYMYGVPKYDINSCAEYMVHKLKENGFTVNYTHPNFIFIDWANVPSQIKQNFAPQTDVKHTPENKHRYIDDYKISSRFMQNINNN